MQIKLPIMVYQIILIKEVANNDKIKPEVFFDKETRFDFLVEKKNKKFL